MTRRNGTPARVSIARLVVLTSMIAAAHAPAVIAGGGASITASMECLGIWTWQFNVPTPGRVTITFPDAPRELCEGAATPCLDADACIRVDDLPLSGYVRPSSGDPCTQAHVSFGEEGGIEIVNALLGVPANPSGIPGIGRAP